ncbi:endonuclease [Puccinia sorghi]|uniref:Endonuclease n=1 Tax=Puccinia sorghi TaxID=27349 RepID=A0A0L6VN91_9BASI|nr:endonuclease [Puccinia sorghi]
MASTLSHSAVFAAGLLIGVGSILYSNQRPSNHSAHHSHPDKQISTKPVNSVSSQHHPFQHQHFFSAPEASTTPSHSSSLKEILKFGNPGPISDFFEREAYAVGYDRRTRNPAWTAEHLTSSNLKYIISSCFHGLIISFLPLIGLLVIQNTQHIPQYLVKFTFPRCPFLEFSLFLPVGSSGRCQKKSISHEPNLLTIKYCPSIFPRKINKDLLGTSRGLCSPAHQLFSRCICVHLADVPSQARSCDQEAYSELRSNRPPPPKSTIGNPPNVAVPTHFAKVVFATGGKHDSDAKGVIGSFVLPNDKISNDQPLTSFEVPVDVVEKSAGLTLLPESVKTNPVRLCSTVHSKTDASSPLLCVAVLGSLVSQITYNKPKKPSK